ncbi:MAG: cbb3-type cytochrome c oxidase subunit I [Candidatus Caldarchaeum sp.]
MIPHYSVRRWLFTTNHKDVGVLYFLMSFYFLVAAGALALLFRVQLAFPNNGFLTAGSFNQAVTIHGIVALLWFLSPLGFALANYVIPLQIGARDLAFPRLNAMSFWMILFGGLLAAIGFFTPGGTLDTGWTVYAPLSTARYTPQVGATLAGAGLLMLIASVTLSTVNFLTTIFRMRARGMSLTRLPMFTWGVGDVVKITLKVAGKIPHSFAVTPEKKSSSPALFNSRLGTPSRPIEPGKTASIVFKPSAPGEYYYICTVPNHAELGMWGRFIVKK